MAIQKSEVIQPLRAQVVMLVVARAVEPAVPAAGLVVTAVTVVMVPAAGLVVTAVTVVMAPAAELVVTVVTAVMAPAVEPVVAVLTVAIMLAGVFQPVSSVTKVQPGLFRRSRAILQSIPLLPQYRVHR
jgi:hypothetical protein